MDYNSPKEHSPSTEWVLYYSSEGYPYYYTHKTGESQWATTYSNESVHQINYDHSIQNDEQENTIVVNEESEAYSSSSSSSLSDDEDDESIDEKFKAYLATPDGRSLLEVF